MKSAIIYVVIIFGSAFVVLIDARCPIFCLFGLGEKTFGIVYSRCDLSELPSRRIVHSASGG